MFYPNLTIDEIVNPGEKAVAEALLAQCPKEWIIIYSKSWLWNDTQYNRNRFKEGEIDFVVVVPGKGFICLEVKSAKKYQLTCNGRWQRYDEKSGYWVTYPKSPWEQVTKNKHALVHVLEERLHKCSLPCGYGAAVIFPLAKMSGILPVGEDNPAVIIEADGMENLSRKLLDILDGWWKGDGQTSEIEGALCPPGALFCSSLALDIQQQNRKLVRLTEHQIHIFQGLQHNRMIQVLGGAGTGKTLLGLELAKEAVQKGQRVLFLCFSRKLASWIASNIRNERFLAVNFHRLARQCVMAASLSWPDNPNSGFWQEEVSELFIEALYILGENAKYDTVIVDEAQDFIGEWLILVRELWNEAGKIVFFGDENQSVFGGQVFDHKQVAKFILQDNCRNTRQIATLCNKILQEAGVDIDQGVVTSLPEGHTPYLSRWGGPAERKLMTLAQLQKWKDEGLSLGQMAVLSPWNEENCLGMGQENMLIEGVPFTRDLDVWRKNKAYLFETIKGFKGLEADAIILTDVTEIKSGYSLQDTYVACSRAKHELTIIPANIRARNMFSRWL